MVLLEDRVGLADCHLSWQLHGVGTIQIHMLHVVPCAPLLVGGPVGTTRTALPPATWLLPLTVYHGRVSSSESVLFSSATLRALRAPILS